MVIEQPAPSDTYLDDDKDQEYRRLSEGVKYPRGIYFIIAHEFCERYTYYGLTSVLSSYLKGQLSIPRTKAKLITQIFMMFSYCLPLFGATLADCWLNKFRTILIMLPLYAAGTILVLVSSIPNVGGLFVALAGLSLTYIGLGGVRPCVVAYGGDQFILPQQEDHLKKYFSIFYFTINAGSFLADIAVPTLSEKDCFEKETCYFAGFCTITITITFATIIFVSGKKFYFTRKPERNVLMKMIRCICYALSKRREKKAGHWLDKASDKYDHAFINDVKTVLRIIVLFLPLPLFRAVFDQHGSRWTFQATRMSGDIGKLKLEAEQMDVANAIFILLFIPLFEAFLYPTFARYNFLRRPLQKLTVGGYLVAVAFVVSALVEIQLEHTDEYLPRPHEAQIRLFNGLPEPLSLEFISPQFDPQVLPSLGAWSKLNIPQRGKGAVQIKYGRNGTEKTGNFDITENALTSYLITAQSVIRLENHDAEKSKEGSPKVMVMYVQTAKQVKVVTVRCEYIDTYIITMAVPYTEFSENSECDTFHVEQDGKIIFENVEMKQGGVYVAFILEKGGDIKTNLLTLVEPNSIHMLWLVPQYALITAAEVMFSVTGFEFSYTQAPLSMKALLQAGWLLTAALGKVIVLSTGKTKFFNRLFYEFLLFAGVVCIDMTVFAILAARYKYVKSREDEVGPSHSKVST